LICPLPEWIEEFQIVSLPGRFKAPLVEGFAAM
jgi:hypothetical protein